MWVRGEMVWVRGEMVWVRGVVEGWTEGMGWERGEGLGDNRGRLGMTVWVRGEVKD